MDIHVEQKQNTKEKIVMANFYLNIKNMCRSEGASLTGTASYICGQTLRDSYDGNVHRYKRNDVLYRHIFLPEGAPEEFRNLQNLCDRLEQAEVRRDARTARYMIGALPNELPLYELSRIVREYVQANFVAYGLCVVVAIHEGRNEDEPQKNNPHVHMLVSTRTVDGRGLNKKKDREHNRRMYLLAWRKEWMLVQNRAYERNGMDIRVSHERLKVQNIWNHEPVKYLSRLEWERKHRESPGRHCQIEMERSR